MSKTKVVLKQKLDTRGGVRTKLKNQSPYSLLIGAIWNKFGGPSAVAKLLDMNFQAPVNYRIRGKVPLEVVVSISSKLGIPVWGLNYEGCKVLYTDPPSWKEVVRMYQLPKHIEDVILKASSKGMK